MKSVSWKEVIAELDEIAEEILQGTIKDKFQLLESLSSVFPNEKRRIKGTEYKIIFFIEFLFYKAGGPYSPTFKENLPVIKSVLYFHPAMKRLLNESGNHAIANMVLKAKGKSKFEIYDRYELSKVLTIWKSIGLYPCTHRSVFNAILRKEKIVRRLNNQEYLLMARLIEIFPQWKKEINPDKLKLHEQIFNIQKRRFSPLLSLLKSRGQSLEEIIKAENLREKPVGIERNNFLSFVLKAKHNFTCQLSDRLGHCSGNIQSHHITPLSQNGEDQSDNIIILCNGHHRDVHTDKLEIVLSGDSPSIKIISGDTDFHIGIN